MQWFDCLLIKVNNVIRYCLENLVPPVIRDSLLFMMLPMRLAFGRDYKRYLWFKTDVLKMTGDEFRRSYAELKVGALLQRESDLNDACLKQILTDVAGFATALDAGCGRGGLAGRMAEIVPSVSAADVFIDPDVRSRWPKVTFVESDLEKLNLPDRMFDVVVSTHTLEHVRHFQKALGELRRVCKSRLIIVVPRERPYRFTANLHLRFFPYVESFLLEANPRSRKFTAALLEGDIYYSEDLE